MNTATTLKAVLKELGWGDVSDAQLPVTVDNVRRAMANNDHLKPESAAVFQRILAAAEGMDLHSGSAPASPSPAAATAPAESAGIPAALLARAAELKIDVKAIEAGCSAYNRDHPYHGFSLVKAIEAEIQNREILVHDRERTGATHF